MLITLETSSAEPLHQQIAAGLRRSLSSGDLAPGARLPSARDLAAALDVNVHTVLRALRELRDEGLLELRRGRGATVTGHAPGRAEVTEQALALLATARRHGYDLPELFALLKGLS